MGASNFSGPVNSANGFNGGGVFNGKFYGAFGDGVNDDHAAIQAACDAAGAAGGKVVLPAGTYMLSDKLVISSDADFSQARLVDDGSQPAWLVEISTGSATDPTDTIDRKTVHLGRISSTKTTSSGGWATASPGGVRIVNAVNCDINITMVENFQVGVLLYGNNTACAYNRFFLNHIVNNQVGLRLDQDGATGGYTNSNHFFGGRFSIYSGEGTNISGARYIHLNDAGQNTPNGNNFFGVDLEGNNPEYNVLCEGQYNQFYGCRWESIQEILFDGSGALDNVINFGYTGYLLEQDKITESNGAGRTTILSSRNMVLSGSDADVAYRVQNTSSSALPALASYPSSSAMFGASIGDWVVGLTGDGLDVKATGESTPRIRATAASGRLYFGKGTDISTAWVDSGTDENGIRINGEYLLIPSRTDANRGSAGTAGRIIFNTDDNNLNIDNGTNWILPDGTTT